jgi:hypothetical protein
VRDVYGAPAHDNSLRLADLAEKRRWVAWREELRENKKGGRKLTKVPYDPNTGRWAKSDNPRTWGTRAEAEALRARLDDGRLCGVGIVLGPMGADFVLAGIDLDACFGNKFIKAYADEIVQRFATYTEVSPSGEGAHLKFLIAIADWPHVQQMLIRAKGTGNAKEFVAGEHHEVCFYGNLRYFTVTDQQFDTTPDTLRVVPLADIKWLLEDAGPRFLRMHKPELATPSRGRKDFSGSGAGFEFMGEQKRAGATKEEAKDSIRTDTGEAGEWAERVDERQLDRAYDNNKARKPNQADLLIEMAPQAELFHDADGVGFADVKVDGHRETWPVRSGGYKRWLLRQFYNTTKSAPNEKAIKTALDTIDAKAAFDGAERRVFLRIGGHDGKIYYDLCNKDWQVIEVDGGGYRLADNAPVRFRRRPGMLPQMMPVFEGGTTKPLRKYVNIRTEDDFILFRAFLLAALRDRGPYPILNVFGEQGSAKSSLVRVARELIDPNKALYTRPKRNEHEMFIAANNAWMLAFDNLSGLTEWMSDGLASVATGSSFSTRSLYTNDDEHIFTAYCPIMMNGIVDVIAKGDLAEREIALRLEPMNEDRRIEDEDLWKEFERDKARILGGLFKAVALGLKRLPQTRPEWKPRMADFARWAVACGDFRLWDPGKFVAAYKANIDRVTRSVLADDMVVNALRRMMAEPGLGGTWTGTNKELLAKLKSLAGEDEFKHKEWPNSPRRLSTWIERNAPLLRRIGINIERQTRTKRARLIRITASGEVVDATTSRNYDPRTAPLR